MVFVCVHFIGVKSFKTWKYVRYTHGIEYYLGKCELDFLKIFLTKSILSLGETVSMPGVESLGF